MEEQPENPYEVSVIPTIGQLSWLPVFLVGICLLGHIITLAWPVTN